MIVVKNFRDDDIDRALDEWGITNLHSGSTGVGAKVAEALGVARGDVIALLDDDDEFLPGKLEAVLRAFSSRPRLRALPQWPAHSRRVGRSIGRDGAREAMEADCSERGLLFNSSSMAVRREVLDARASSLRASAFTPARRSSIP